MTLSACRRTTLNDTVLQFWLPLKPALFSCAIFPHFLRHAWMPCVTPLKRTVLAPTLLQSPRGENCPDADRLEALGAIGLARVFAVSGALGVALFDAEDPFAQRRVLNDKQFALDHFQTKLLKLPETMQTARGRELAQYNAAFLVTWMAKLSAELNGEYASFDPAVVQAFRPQHA